MSPNVLERKLPQLLWKGFHDAQTVFRMAKRYSDVANERHRRCVPCPKVKIYFITSPLSPLSPLSQASSSLRANFPFPRTQIRISNSIDVHLQPFVPPSSQ